MRSLAILTVKNEAAFLLEWLAHHRAVGFTDFLVFSNDCDDGTDAMLERLAALGWLSHVPNPGPWPEGPQWAALKAADRHPLTRAADWILFLDVDEFVNIHAGDGTLDALRAALPEASAIPLTWRFFGNCGVVDYRDTPVTEQFTRAAPSSMLWPWRASLFKTLFRNDGTYGKLGVHRPRQPDPARIGAARWFDGSGTPLPPDYARSRIFTPPGLDCHRLVQLNHYALGAMQSYVLKAARGRANREASPFDISYWVERNFCAEEDRTIARMAAASGAILAELRADPVLGALHERAVAWRRARIDALMLEEDYRSLFGRLMLTPPSRPLPAPLARRMLELGMRARAAGDAGETI
ncbi:glycosyl transferase family 2 [Rhodobacter xanthinilyticus]|uniref:Glycosyl transferase family 2 n=1 Tax=Rhodobacter xanthinilyticus TaxID=1850250 RepID=A0A1D9MCR4_9RHOB|nr:glycosyltransferase family 2 protein [Rhodobacter xanthinilyticus]AOZ69664.1 glycosyl transferase family 2 [Rhodobacter xanthinilyticus]